MRQLIAAGSIGHLIHAGPAPVSPLVPNDEDGLAAVERLMYQVLRDQPGGIRFYELVRQVRQSAEGREPVATLRAVLHDLLADGLVERVGQGTYRAALLIDLADASA